MDQYAIQHAFESALQRHQAGQLEQAERLYRQVLTAQPGHATAIHHLGLIAHQAGRNDVALDFIRRAIALRPNYAEALYNLGTVLKHTGQQGAAIAAFRQAIALWPNYAEAWGNLGVALRETGQLDEAIAAYRRAITLRANLAETHYNLGTALKDKGQTDAAIAAYQQAIALRPSDAQAHNSLGVVLRDSGQLDEAVVAYRRAMALDPGLPGPHNNLGVALEDRGRIEEAVAAYRKAIAIDPAIPEFHFNLALALLASGDFQQGWEEYEWRLKCKGLASYEFNVAGPGWDGSPLAGRTILLQDEQGFGDTLQFVRYLPLVAQRGGRIIVECQPDLQPLLQMTVAGCQVIARGQPRPAFDVHCRLPGLPRVFGTTLESIPNGVPYLWADPGRQEQWRRRLAGLASIRGRPYVGLIWAGRAFPKPDRTCGLAAMAPLAAVRGVQFVSLQTGPPAAEARDAPMGMVLADLSGDLRDFADTAALMANLDLVITVDTAAAHLAGAMGRPTWTLLKFAADWRWLADREDSPWYPTMRLFRQPSPGDWAAVSGRIAGELALFTERYFGRG